jgi:hypothetical protein
MATFTLTTGIDTFVGTDPDNTVTGTASTLNAGDSLDGGAGYNSLLLVGAGNFDLSALAQFTNFEEVDLANFAGGASNLMLRNGTDLTVTVDNEAGGGGIINLADGAVTLNLGNSTGYVVNGSTGATNINSSGGRVVRAHLPHNGRRIHGRSQDDGGPARAGMIAEVLAVSKVGIRVLGIRSLRTQAPALWDFAISGSRRIGLSALGFLHGTGGGPLAFLWSAVWTHGPEAKVPFALSASGWLRSYS